MTTSQKTPTTRSSITPVQQTGRNGITRFFARTVRINAGISHHERTTIPVTTPSPHSTGAVLMPRRPAKIERDIPLYLIPDIVKRGVVTHGQALERVIVSKTRNHFYNVSIRTRRVKRELRSSWARSMIRERRQDDAEDMGTNDGKGTDDGSGVSGDDKGTPAAHGYCRGTGDCTPEGIVLDKTAMQTITLQFCPLHRWLHGICPGQADTYAYQQPAGDRKDVQRRDTAAPHGPENSRCIPGDLGSLSLENVAVFPGIR